MLQTAEHGTISFVWEYSINIQINQVFAGNFLIWAKFRNNEGFKVPKEMILIV